MVHISSGFVLNSFILIIMACLNIMRMVGHIKILRCLGVGS